MINTSFLIPAAFFCFLLLLTIYIYLILKKARNIHCQNRKKAWVEKHREEIEIYSVTGEGASSFTPCKNYQFEAIEDYFVDYVSNFRIESGLNPVKSFVEQYFVPRYRKRLLHSKWSDRMNTLYFIDLFGIRMMQDDLLQLLQSKKCSPEERYQIYLLLADFAYPRLQDLMKKAKKLPPFLLNEMLNRLILPDKFESYIENFFEFPYEWQLSILDVLRAKNLRSLKLQELLEELMTAEDREIRVRAAKTIAGLEYISSTDIIIRILEVNLHKEEWQDPQSMIEKMMLARLMGNIRDERFLPYLKLFISDFGYLVRSEAARSLRKYKKGRDILLAIAAAHPDRYARNIAQEWLERSIEYE
jgi:hypothetical protein